MLLGLTFGEFFVVAFIVVAVVGAPYWPRVGGAIAVWLGALAGEGKTGQEPSSRR
jgi:hypothetical protein